MPVEIRELIIRAYVESENQKEIKAKNDSSGDNENCDRNIDEIAQLLEVINSKNER